LEILDTKFPGVEKSASEKKTPIPSFPLWKWGNFLYKISRGLENFAVVKKRCQFPLGGNFLYKISGGLENFGLVKKKTNSL